MSIGDNTGNLVGNPVIVFLIIAIQVLVELVQAIYDLLVHVVHVALLVVLFRCGDGILQVDGHLILVVIILKVIVLIDLVSILVVIIVILIILILIEVHDLLVYHVGDLLAR